MEFFGTVHNSVVVFDSSNVPPEGLKVSVRVPASRESNSIPDDDTEPPAGDLTWLLKFAGAAEGLPSDMAEQHDHYLHGTPKRNSAA